MASVLPSTVQEWKCMQNSIGCSTVLSYMNGESNKNFNNTTSKRGYDCEVNIPSDLENCNIGNFDSYFNFDENNQTNNLEVNSESQEDGLIPEGGRLRQRCLSYSSVSSSMDERCLVYNNIGVKSFNTVCMDSGSTCISSDHIYYPGQTTFKGLDAEETYQNLDTLLKQVPNYVTNYIPIFPVGSPMNDSNSENTMLSSFPSHSQNSFYKTSVNIKCPASDLSIDNKLLTLTTGSKRTHESPSGSRYYDSRKKNNIASKNRQKTCNEKQKEMEIRLIELEKERDYLKMKSRMLEGDIQTCKQKLYAIFQRRR